MATTTTVAAALVDDAAARAAAAVSSSDSVAAAAAAIMKAVAAATTLTLPRPRDTLPPLPILPGVQRGRLTEGSGDDLSHRMHEMTGCQMEPSSISVTLETHGYVEVAEAAV